MTGVAVTDQYSIHEGGGVHRAFFHEILFYRNTVLLEKLPRQISTYYMYIKKKILIIINIKFKLFE